MRRFRRSAMHFRRPKHAFSTALEAACGVSTSACTTDPEKVECKRCLGWLVRAGQTAEGKLRAAEAKVAGKEARGG